ncbi:hypothetical protein DUNSADRAFT_9990 [Dunaliella salina]|uniref:Encoded protein n=1 Tax=Dunaliella salina TaxID=3046 RepID=A0ABQ7GGA7_DUNSA|nr:hypothetical protein DUNSADRAFT_9990 [Dunaliella salina]|eukprot:KAF5833647.1 hypothetical protein DUNSADRAFT_9990 [Dunaliella salina]
MDFGKFYGNPAASVPACRHTDTGITFCLSPSHFERKSPFLPMQAGLQARAGLEITLDNNNVVGNFTSFDRESFAYVLQRLLLSDNDLIGESAKIYRCTSSCLLWFSSRTSCRENGLKDWGEFPASNICLSSTSQGRFGQLEAAEWEEASAAVLCGLRNWSELQASLNRYRLCVQKLPGSKASNLFSWMAYDLSRAGYLLFLSIWKA